MGKSLSPYKKFSAFQPTCGSLDKTVTIFIELANIFSLILMDFPKKSIWYVAHLIRSNSYIRKTGVPSSPVNVAMKSGEQV